MAERKDSGLVGFFLPSFLIAHDIGKAFPMKQSHHIQDPIEPSKALWNHWLQEVLDPAHKTGKCICGVKTAFSALRVEKKERGRRDGITIRICGWFFPLMKGLFQLIFPVFVLRLPIRKEASYCSSPLSGQPVRLPGRRLSHTQPTSQMSLSFPILSVGFFQLS